METTPGANANTLLLGTNNAHKASEITAMLAGALRVLTPSDLDFTQEPVEDGATFEANALIKARFYAQRAGLPCLADDSGLEVDALGGRPGVYSARYAPTDAERITRLLAEIPAHAPSRAARFVCVAALVTPDGREIVRRGVCEGEIAAAPRGRHGFGYDPVFFLPQENRTMAEMPPEEKNKRSHRGRAMAAILPEITALFSPA